MAFHEYPYTDFHEMNLDWILQTVKQLTEDWAQVRSDWEDEQAAFADLQSYIENYFNNLDVQQEINVKLDGLVLDGTMSELIAPYVASGLPAEVASQLGDVVAAQIGAVVAAQIGAVVADQLPAIAASAAATEVGTWLSTHIDPDTGYVIDDSLTVQGAAADAKAVGDEVTAIKSALSYKDFIGTETGFVSSEEIDGYVKNDGSFGSSDTDVRTGYIETFEGAEIMATLRGYATRPIIAFYNESYTYLSDVSVLSDQQAIINVDMVVPSGVKYVVFVSRKGYTDRAFSVQVKEKLNNIVKAVNDKVDDVADNYMEIGTGKNKYNYILAEGGRLSSDVIGNIQAIITDTDRNVLKMPVTSGNTYALSGIDAYSIVDVNNVVVTARTATASDVVTIPTYGAFLWVQSNYTKYNTITQVEEGNSITGYESYREVASIKLNGTKIMDTKDLPMISNMDESTVVNPSMSKVEFCQACNNAISAFSALNKVHTRSFYYFPDYQSDSAVEWNFIYKTLNHNFRTHVADGTMSLEKICDNVNKAFSSRIYRFCDAKPYTGNSRDYSLTTNLQADEPSAIISDDGSIMYIYAHLKRIETTDGVNWSVPSNVILSDNVYALHIGINKISGVYYLIGCRSNHGGNLVLYTSTDGLNFSYQGILFKESHYFSENYAVANWGNPYLIKNPSDGKFYLFIETQSDNTSWMINLAMCSDILHANEDGTIGDWENAETNPIIISPFNGYTNNTNSAGNPDFFKGADGQPIRYEGKYYMYFHSTLFNYSNILRAYSEDLIHWTVEGPIIDNRDAPSAGDNHSGNADHCLAYFKDKSYLFYTWDINDPQRQPYIKYTIDDRSASEMLSLVP